MGDQPTATPVRNWSCPGVERSFPSDGPLQVSLQTCTGAASSDVPPIRWVEIDQRSSKWCSTRTPIPKVRQNGSPMEKENSGATSSVPPILKSWAVTGGSDAGAPYFGDELTGGRDAGVTCATFVSWAASPCSAARTCAAANSK